MVIAIATRGLIHLLHWRQITFKIWIEILHLAAVGSVLWSKLRECFFYFSQYHFLNGGIHSLNSKGDTLFMSWKKYLPSGINEVNDWALGCTSLSSNPTKVTFLDWLQITEHAMCTILHCYLYLWVHSALYNDICYAFKLNLLFSVVKK